MDSVKETYIAAFYSHKLQVQQKCDLQSPSEELMKESDYIMSCLLEEECIDIIQVLKKYEFNFHISAGDIPQFSNLDDCFYKVPYLIRECGLNGITFSQLGFMLRRKPRKEGADTKYGENHAKTAAQMGLCSIKSSRIYPSHLGVAFCNLEGDKQKKLLPKFILFIPYILKLFVSSAKYEDVIGSVSFLSESTQKRRLTNIWSLINHINKQLPYELQIIRY